jgi:hypothetical protein
MHIAFLGSISGSGPYAARNSGHSVEVPYWKHDTVGEMVFGHALGFPKTSLLRTPEVIITSSYAVRQVIDLIKTWKPLYVIWDLGPKPPTKPQINRVTAPLQIVGYETVMLRGLSSHDLGYNYQEDRAIIIAKRGEAPVVIPPKLPIRRPFTPLSVIVDASKDEKIVPFLNGTMLFHKEPRPWSFVSKTLGDSFIKSHPLSVKVGAVWYAIEGKLHRLTFNEAAQIVGMPVECQMKLSQTIDDDGMLVYTALRDISYPLWIDIMERTLL